METSLLWLVFTSGLLSSTLLPGNSEIVFSGAILERPDIMISLLAVVTIGNTLGGMISWGMGRLVAERFPLKPADKPGQRRAQQLIQRWGAPVLLLSWVPIIGDPLCIAAGWLKTNPLLSLIYITTGKLLRYALLAYALSY